MGGIRFTTLALTARTETLEAAATLVGATRGPVFGHFVGHMANRGFEELYEPAVEHLAVALARDAYTAAAQRGAAMTYDEIIAYTLDQLNRLTTK